MLLQQEHWSLKTCVDIAEYWTHKKGVLVLGKMQEEVMFHKVMALNVGALKSISGELWYGPPETKLSKSNTNVALHLASTLYYKMDSWSFQNTQGLKEKKTYIKMTKKGKAQALSPSSLLRSFEWQNQLCKQRQKYSSLAGNFNSKWWMGSDYLKSIISENQDFTALWHWEIKQVKRVFPSIACYLGSILNTMF